MDISAGKASNIIILESSDHLGNNITAKIILSEFENHMHMAADANHIPMD